MAKRRAKQSRSKPRPLWKDYRFRIIGSIMLATGLLFLLQAVVGGQSAPAAVSSSASARPDYQYDYDPADVAYDQGIFGIHEMGPAQTPIPFLPPGSPQPRLIIHHDFWDFGEVGASEIANHTFALENVGEAPLTVSRVYTTCGCTTAELSAQVIPPGKVAMLRLVLDAGYHDVRGQQVRRGIIIENNDPNFSEAEVWTAAAVGWQ